MKTTGFKCSRCGGEFDTATEEPVYCPYCAMILDMSCRLQSDEQQDEAGNSDVVRE